MSGAFFCLEGIDGCGKSTQLNLLEQALNQRNRKTLRIREPGGTEISEEIRSIILKNRNHFLSPLSELLLYNAARAQLLFEIIRPALKAGDLILADRFAWSTLAYQGYGRQGNIGEIENLLQITCANDWPNLTFILDIPVPVFRERSIIEGRVPDRIESENSDFFERVRQGYLLIAKANPGKVHVIDGTKSPEFVHQQIMTLIDKEFDDE
jgi:dTMP kinase